MADAPGFPKVAQVFDELGIVVRGEDVWIRREAPLAALRQALMRVDEETARWRRELLKR